MENKIFYFNIMQYGMLKFRIYRYRNCSEANDCKIHGKCQYPSLKHCLKIRERWKKHKNVSYFIVFQMELITDI
jgi:hypothetical protein